MNCRESRFQLALFVGGDLGDASAVGLQRHLATCPDCREHHDGLSDVMGQVERIEADAPAVVHRKSVWPQLAAVIKVREQDRTRRFNGWVAGFAVAATVLAMVTISQSLPSSRSDFQFSDITPIDELAVPVAYPNTNMNQFQDRQFNTGYPINHDQRLQWLQSLPREHNPNRPPVFVSEPQIR